MSKLVMKAKCELSPAEAVTVAERLSVPEHSNDKGPPTCWHIYEQGLYAFFEPTSMLVVGIAEASGRPTANPGWWIDSTFRGKGYGSLLIDKLAEFLKNDGVKAIGHILIQTQGGQYDLQSSALAKRMRSHFS